MPDPQFDIDLIKRVLREATAGEGAKFSQRSLAKAAGEGRDAVGDILNDRNRNPTTKLLANLARALEGDLSMFGLAEARSEPPTEDELMAALRDMLPDMPRGAPDKRARYLAEGVARILRLPQSRRSTDLPRIPSEGEAVAPPPEATSQV